MDKPLVATPIPAQPADGFDCHALHSTSNEKLGPLGMRDWQPINFKMDKGFLWLNETMTVLAHLTIND